LIRIITLIILVAPLALDTFVLSTALGVAGINRRDRVRVIRGTRTLVGPNAIPSNHPPPPPQQLTRRPYDKAAAMTTSSTRTCTGTTTGIS